MVWCLNNTVAGVRRVVEKSCQVNMQRLADEVKRHLELRLIISFSLPRVV